MAVGLSRSMDIEGANLNAMKVLGHRIARRFEHCIYHQGFDAFRPKKTLEVFGSRIESIQGKATI